VLLMPCVVVGISSQTEEVIVDSLGTRRDSERPIRVRDGYPAPPSDGDDYSYEGAAPMCCTGAVLRFANRVINNL
jgi:hypothetical protein